MLMNLDYWREHDIANQVVRWGRDNNDRIQFPDQDSINYICRNAKIHLPLKYDIVDGFFHDDYYYKNYPQELRECVESPVIIHYAGQAPWVVELSSHLLQDEWEKYNQALRQPVKKVYQSKGFLKIKVILYRLFHFNTNRRLERQDVIHKLTQ
jgi:lipopolysaccharide biosynthesis glycosyltransferase